MKDRFYLEQWLKGEVDNMTDGELLTFAFERLMKEASQTVKLKEARK